MGAWLRDVVGVRAANALAPSVRFAVESAALGALANASGEKKKTLAETLLRGAATFPAAEMNALVGDAANTPEKAAAEATSLVAAGHTCLKLKVARGDGARGSARGRRASPRRSPRRWDPTPAARTPIADGRSTTR